MSPKERAKLQRATKLGIAIGESTILFLDTLAVPSKRKRAQLENYIRRELQKFNRMRRKVHLPPKTYVRINSQGKVEKIV